MASSGRGRRHDIFRILLPPDRLPHFPVDLPASNSGCADGVCRFDLADLSVTAAHKISIPLQPGPWHPRAGFADPVVPRDGCERSTMEGAGQVRRAKNFVTITQSCADTKCGKPPPGAMLWHRLERNVVRRKERNAFTRDLRAFCFYG